MTSRVMNPRIFVTDHSLKGAEQLLPVLEACVAAGERNLFIVAAELSDAAIGLRLGLLGRLGHLDLLAGPLQEGPAAAAERIVVAVVRAALLADDHRTRTSTS